MCFIFFQVTCENEFHKKYELEHFGYLQDVLQFSRKLILKVEDHVCCTKQEWGIFVFKLIPRVKVIIPGHLCCKEVSRAALDSGAECQCNVRRKHFTVFQLLQTQGILSSSSGWKQKQNPSQCRMPCLERTNVSMKIFQLKVLCYGPEF